MQNNHDTWITPPIEKIYEALTAIADDRVELGEDNRSAKIYSSSRNKFYTVTYDPAQHAIMSNDNSAYYTGQLSYPMIALLMLRGEITYDNSLLEPMRGIKWKDINQKHKNNYAAAVKEVLTGLADTGVDTGKPQAAIQDIYTQVMQLKLGLLGPKQRPSAKY